VPAIGALIVAPDGTLVDQLSGDPLERALAEIRGSPIRETLLKDLVDAIRYAKDDERIKVLVLELDGMDDAGLSKLQELADEILQFKESGKPVVAVGDSFSRNQYYLAAHADDVYMHPMGYVFIDGYSRYLPYYREALEKLQVDFHVWSVGEYKSFVEPITRDDMSEADRVAASEYLGALWDSYQVDVTAARELSVDTLQRYADNAVELLTEAGGNTGQMALNVGLVDELLPHDLMAVRIESLVGAPDDDESGSPRIRHSNYLRAMRAGAVTDTGSEAVAVLVAAGTILDGAQPPGAVGGESTAALIRQARDDDRIKALVLRVDSPGGSAFASELILRELEVFQQTGRPVVVSMSSVAASGGYWISMSADEIWASPATLTGSIGIGATIPTVPRTLAALGIHIDGLGTTELAGQFNLTRPLGPDAVNLIAQSIDNGYDQFIGKVAAHRELELAAVDTVAQGRVWIGTRAQELDLVDRLGNLGDAIASAAELAGLAEGDFAVRYIEKELGLSERLALEFVKSTGPLLRGVHLGPAFSSEFQRLLDVAAAPFKWVDSLNDPRDLYAYCFCDVL
jgi:protease-4